MSPSPAAFRGWPFVIGLPAAGVHGLLVAWVAVSVQPYFAPWLLFPVLMGLVLGATCVALVRLSQIGHRPTILLLTVVAAAGAVVGQHGLSYRDACRVARQDVRHYEKARQLAPLLVEGRPLGPPGSLAEYLRWEAARGRQIGPYTARGTLAWLSWALDGLLLLVAALALVVPALKQPYCDRCRSWFRTIRRGTLDGAAAVQLGARIGATVPDGCTSARYRLVSCNAGCGPTGLEWAWTAPEGRPGSARVWLDKAARNQVFEILDGVDPSAPQP